MTRFGGKSTSVLLEKVNSKLRGESSKPSDDDDGLQAYLSGLSKTSKVKTVQKADFAWDKFGDVSDPSVSEDEPVKKSPSSGFGTAGSKFLKKKQPDQNQEVVGKKSIQSGQKSAALSKVTGLSSKYDGKSRPDTLRLSGSDVDFSFSIDGQLLGDVESLTPAIAPRHDKSVSDDSASFGKKGSRFMKKSTKPEETHSPVRQASAEKPKTTPTQQKNMPSQQKQPAVQAQSKLQGTNAGQKPSQWPSLQQKKTQFAETVLDKDDESSSLSLGKGGAKFMKKKSAVTEKQVSPLPSPKEHRKKAEKKTEKQNKPRDMFTLKTSEKYSTTVRLDSDEESLQGFIHDLASTPSDVSIKSPPKSPKTPRGILKTPRTTHSANTLEDIDEEKGNTTLSEEDSFKINVLDLDALEPVELSPPDHKPASKSKEKTKSSKSKDSKKKESKSSGKSKTAANKQKSGSIESDNVFAEMGLYTVDDLLGRQSDSDHIGTDIEEDVSFGDRSPSPLRSILSPSPKLERTPRSSRTRVHYSLDDLTDARSPSPEVISTARLSKSASVVYTDDFHPDASLRSDIHTGDVSEIDSVSEHLGHSQSSHARTRTNRRSESEYYSDDFISATESRWSAKRREYALSHSESVDSEYSVYSDTFSEMSESRTDTHNTRKSRRSRGTEKEVQTGSSLADLTYRWQAEQAGVAYVSPGYGLNQVDPKLVATHVVSADALEAMTGYSPSVLALNDMLRQQLQLTENYISVQKTMYQSLLNSTQPDYVYTTLEDTKRFIKKHRKPQLTFDEALRQVKQEMGLEK